MLILEHMIYFLKEGQLWIFTTEGNLEPMKTTFTTIVEKDDKVNATGLRIPPEAIAALASGKRPKVKVTLGNYTYRSTVAAYGDLYMLPLSAENRTAAGVQAGDPVEVTLELDTEPRTVEIPADLAAALADKPGAMAAFEVQSYTLRKEAVRQVESAKAIETRRRRIAAIVARITMKTTGSVIPRF